MIKTAFVLATSSVALAFGAPAHGILNMVITQATDGTISLAASGSVNTASLQNNGAAAVLGEFSQIVSNPDSLVARVTAGNRGPQPFVYLGTERLDPLTFGILFKSDIFNDVLSSSGDPIGFFSDGLAFPGSGLYLPAGYRSGSQLSANATFTAPTSAQNLIPGLYTMTWGGGANADQLNLCVGNDSSTSAPPRRYQPRLQSSDLLPWLPSPAASAS